MPKLFWHQVQAARRPHGLAREGPRHLARDLVARVRRARPRGRHGPGRARARARRRRVDPGRHRPEWLYADLGTHGASAASPTASIRPTRPSRSSTSSTTAAPRFLFVENEEQLDKFLDVRERCPRPGQDLRLRHGGPGRLQRPEVMPFDELLALGRALRHGASRRCGRSWSRSLDAPRSWRSWSTPPAPPGRPRARCCRHRNIIFQLEQRRRLHPARRRTTSSSPSCRSATSPSAPSRPSCRCARGAIVNFAESVETVPENIREVAPTTVLRRAAHLGEASIPASPSA